MVGAPFAAVLSDNYGRRKAMFIGAIVINIGMVIVSTASVLAQFVVGRFVLGFGVAILTVGAPAYAIEIAPPHWRGRCTGRRHSIFRGTGRIVDHAIFARLLQLRLVWWCHPCGLCHVRHKLHGK
jgi:MFS family permease